MKLPPLNALFAFHSAAMHESFVRAAEDLCVTPGAVSRHVRNLEATLGLTLFIRGTRQVTLTDAGRELFTATASSFGQLASDVERIAAGSRRGLRLRCSMMCMRHWLMPRLSRLHEALPDLDVSFAIARSADPLTPDVDCAIRLGAGRWPGYAAQRLFCGDLVPICAPQDTAPEEVNSVCDMKGRRLIRPFHSGALTDPWQAWLGEQAEEILSNVDSIELRAEGLSYQAAQQGIGIALARVGFVIDDIAAGHLRAVLPPRPHQDYAYHLVYPSGARQNPNVPAFRKWLAAEAAATEESIRQHLPSF